MSKYKLVATSFPALNDPIKGHRGTFDNQICDCNLVEPSSVAKPYTQQLETAYVRPKISVMSFEISDLGAQQGPNWFGASYRSDITAFDSVNIFFHPVPTNEMPESGYRARSGGWSKLFRYTEHLGRQMAAASNNQIVIVPFFNPGSWSSTGIFAPNWHEIVIDILRSIKARVTKMPAEQVQVLFRNVVLSDFSRGRQNMYHFKKAAPQLDGYLREIWDFDGVTGAPPYQGAPVRGIVYDQAASNNPHSFHAPPSRWEKYHNSKHLRFDDVHGDFPAMLAWHAATISTVGK
jgi:hypothetical protein